MLIGASSALAAWRAGEGGATGGMAVTTLAVAGRSSLCRA
jgi:hypothetical protein